LGAALGRQTDGGHLGVAARVASWRWKAPQVSRKAVPFAREVGGGPWSVQPPSEVPNFEEDGSMTVGCPGKPELASVPPRAC
jgi:hypothetical protein